VNLGLDMSMRLQQKLSFQMIQSLKLLQVNTLQLEQMLKTELEMNPLLVASEDMELEEREPGEQEETKEEEVTNPDNAPEEELKVDEESVDWENYLEEGFDLGYSRNEEVDRSEERYEPTPVYQITLEEHLTEQIAEKTLTEEKKLLVQFLIGCLDADGYLRIPLDDIAAFAKIDIHHVEEALGLLWTFNPPGVGARNLRECMLLQLRAKRKEASLAWRIVEGQWELFERLKIPDIARKLDVEPRMVQEAIEELKTLNPKPGYQYNPDKPSTIIPDLIVEKIDGKFEAMLNDRSMPSLHINKSYAGMLRRGSTARQEVKKYIREKFNSASWFISAIEQRKATMLKVMYAIIERQKVFFEQGPPNLSPLRLQDIADMIGMHISTVSRVTSNKYVQTAHGIFELKYFFTEAVVKDAGGEDVSSERIKNRIRQLVEGENNHEPLSDQKIADLLSGENLAVARRTVAKYREQLKILPARLRQKYE
jgi:RNA polymerase sigma-54 factor